RTARRRLQESGGLLAHGLPIAHVTKSVSIEQAAAAISAVVLGSLLGLALAVAGLPVRDLSRGTLQLAGISLVCALGCLLLCLLVVPPAPPPVPAQLHPLPAEQRR